jgi:hypothetical protein
MRRTAAYHRRSPSAADEALLQPHLSQKDQIETQHQTTSTGPSSPTPTTPLIWTSFLVGTAALLYTLLHFSNVQNVSCQTDLLPSQIVMEIWDMVEVMHWSFCYRFATIQPFMAYVNSGLYFAIFWLSTISTPFHYWVMDTLKGKGAESLVKMCGNKFMECRPWD